jgi:hypothetical protein
MGLIFALPLLFLATAALLAVRTTPTDLPTSRIDLLVGLLGYPAACAAIYLTLGRDISSNLLRVAVILSPGLLAGAITRRMWCATLPPIAWIAFFLVTYLGDPRCSACGEEDWLGLGVTTIFFIALPAAGIVLTGIGLGKLVANAKSRRPRRRDE